MKIAEAFQILQGASNKQSSFQVVLACGFTPLHLRLFLAAHLQQALPTHQIEVTTLLYGNLVGNLETLVGGVQETLAVALEWTDLDPRLGYRALGGWGPNDLPDIITSAQDALRRIERALGRIGSARIALSLPTLPLPPVFYTPAWQSGEAELSLQQSIAELGASLAKRSNIFVVCNQRLAEDSPPAARFDLKSELLTGLPYTIPHADAVGCALAELIQPRSPKKGLITDLDDTLWDGLVGEIGPESIAWDLHSHNQLHGLYQQLLRALSDQGVLLGVASKNDPTTVELALARKDMLLPASKLFPLEVHWNAKSQSVSRILQKWNITADSTVFVDDSPLELAEVQAAHPDMECILFPKGDYAGSYRFFRHLRNLFGKPQISAEDHIRVESIRRSSDFQQLSKQNGTSPDGFLASVNAVITVDFDSAPTDARVLELVNKTNQFNLNGVRYTETYWQHALASPDAFLMTVSYQDKFGPLGRIAVIQGQVENSVLHVAAWAMSCRVFARRVEHQCLSVLFEQFSVNEIGFAFAPTPKNSPLQDFFSWNSWATSRVRRSRYLGKCLNRADQFSIIK